ncbi:hypothetical protein CBR_g21836 [Chara braunii]|uniref:Endonuclease/exonuclease/phosphatase domain-containing protein n=1 Tax=Chara braunii TaxID=69332 RepID=A0A388JUR0_CHABU|nr:hypothetical protein CBR_g21836 [Chara braunii]|eukprot:GBG61493.1 hypothetical protein CBR_g21836 [Chara braunii]
MVGQGRGQAQQRGRSPPCHTDISIMDEDRMKLLISKCYNDGILPEKFRHGEWRMEGGVNRFVVTPRLYELTTTWLKERTVTVIFQGAARDLPMKIRENLIRAYENGWYRERIFDRSIKRGRVHAEGPNVVSYVAKSREVAQWMISKAEDKVVIRGVEYGMLFKPWLTKTELEERRWQDDESKFWVMALRVPLRAMFHVESMVETSMGHVINSLPPKQDKTRPKFMNLKFELVREAKEKFEAEIQIRLGSEVLRIKFVCKHTPWCTRCRWWFHTAEEDCPRAGEEEPVSNPSVRQRDVQPFQNQRASDDRHIRSAARENIRVAEDRPQGASSTRGAGRIQEARILSGGQNLARSSRSSTPQGERGASGGGPISDVARMLSPEAGALQQQDLSGGMHLQGYAGGYQAYALPDGQMDQAIHVVGLLDRNDNIILRTTGLSEIPLQSAIREKVRYLFADRFEFRIFPEFYLPKMRVELEDGKSIRYTVVFMDARFSTEVWQGLRNVGLDNFPLEAITQPSIGLLAEVIVEPGISASFLADLNLIMPRSSNLLSASFVECLSAEWPTRASNGGPDIARSSIRPPQPSNPHLPQLYSMGRLQIATWNVQGLGDTSGRRKGARLKSWIHRKDIDVIMVQETKLSENKLAQLKDWWDGSQLWSPARDTKGGVTILFHNRIDAQLLDYDCDLWGRWYWVKVAIGAEDWVFTTMYAPNKPSERLRFFELLPFVLPRANHLVIAGDWNAVCQPGLDSDHDGGLTSDQLKLLSWMEEWDLHDAYRELYPTKQAFTWFGRSPQHAGVSRRIDFFLVSEGLKSNVIRVKTDNYPISDHKAVVMTCALSEVAERGPGYFRLNTDLLNDDEIVRWVMNFWLEWKQMKPHSESVAEWIDAGLRVVSLRLDSYSQISAFQRNKEEADLKASVEEAERRMGLHPISDLLWAEERKVRLQEWERWLKILETKSIITSDRVTKETFRRLLPKNRSVQMKELNHPHQLGRPVATTSEDMCSYAMDYFQDILTTRRPYDSAKDNMAEGSSLWINLTVRVSEEVRIGLNRPVTEEELVSTLRCMARGKAPGDDGLPVEFFECCGEGLRSDLVEMYNTIRTRGRLGKSMTRGVISLLFKKGERNELIYPTRTEITKPYYR